MPYSLTLIPNSVFTGQNIRIVLTGLDVAGGESYDYGIIKDGETIAGYDPETSIIFAAYTAPVSVKCKATWIGSASSVVLTVKVYICNQSGTQIGTAEKIFRLQKGGHVVPFEIDDDVAALPVSGWLPHDTKRNNLYRLMLACGVNIVKNADGNPRFTFIRPNNDAPEIADDNIFLSGNVEYDRPYSSVTVAEHTYTELLDANPVTLFDNSEDQQPLWEETEVWFDQAPVIVSTLATEGNLTIVFASENSAILTGQGKLTGIPYTHTTRAITRGNAAGDKEKTVSVPSDTMVSELNSENLLNRLFAFYCPTGQVKKISNEIRSTGESCGKAYRFSNPFGEQENAFLARMDSKASTFNRAACEYYAGYNPPGQEGIYTHCLILDKATFEQDGGVFTVPDEARSGEHPRIRVVMIGGGTGGTSGWPGENGRDAYSHTNVESGADITMMFYGAEGGEGGEGGDGGKPGLVKIVTIENPDYQYSYTIGDGGEGGAATGFIPDTLDELKTAMQNETGETYTDEQVQVELNRELALTDWSGTPNAGEDGTDTTFGEYSTTDRDSYRPEAGVYDSIHANYYALAGKSGVKGGKGGSRKVGNGEDYAWSTDGESVTYGDTTYEGGHTGRPKTGVEDLPECDLIIYGGNGAGAAVGLDREDHEHMDGDQSWQAWYSVVVDE